MLNIDAKVSFELPCLDLCLFFLLLHSIVQQPSTYSTLFNSTESSSIDHPTAILHSSCFFPSFLNPCLHKALFRILVLISQTPSNFQHFHPHSHRDLFSQCHSFTPELQPLGQVPHFPFCFPAFLPQRILLHLHQSFPPFSQLPEHFLSIDPLSKRNLDILSRSRYKSRKLS